MKFLEDNLMWILIGILLALILGMIIHYYAGHHIRRGMKKVQQFVYKNEPSVPVFYDSQKSNIPITNEIMNNPPNRQIEERPPQLP